MPTKNELEVFIKNLFTNSFVKESNKYLDLQYDEEKLNEWIEQMKNKYDEEYASCFKKQTPKRTPAKEKNKEKATEEDEEEEEDEANCYLTYEEFVEKQNKNPGSMLCSWIFSRGGPNKTNKHCARIAPVNPITKKEWTKEEIENYEVRCKGCKRNTGDGPNKRNKDRYLKIRIGNQVKGTPTPGASLPESENEIPMHAMTGLKEGVVSPTPENFLTGQDTGNVTPTKAKKRNSPAKLKLKPIKHGVKDSYTDYKIRDLLIDESAVLVRKIEEDDKYYLGGKFKNEFKDDDKYLQGVCELEEDDLSKLEIYNLEYKFYGKYQTTKKNTPDIPDLDDDEDDDDNVDDLLNGLEIS